MELQSYFIIIEQIADRLTLTGRYKFLRDYCLEENIYSQFSKACGLDVDFANG